MSFSSLPNEIILEIAQNSMYIYKLYLCSKRLQKILEPLLLHEFRQDLALAPYCLSHTFSFLLKLVRKPHLAAHVKAVVFSPIPRQDPADPEDPEECDEEGEKPQIDVSALTPSQLLWVKETYLRTEIYGEEHCENWYRDFLGLENWDAITALLISMLSPGVEELIMASSSLATWAETPYIDAVLSHTGSKKWESLLVIGGKSLLPHLRSVDLAFYDNIWGMNLEVLVPYLSVPSLRQMRANFVGGIGFQVQGLVFGCEELVLEDSALDDESMVNFLRCFVRLRKLVYVYGIYGSYLRGEGEEQEQEPDPSSIGHGLQHLKGSLEVLVVDFNQAMGLSGYFWERILPNKEEFVKLKWFDDHEPPSTGN
ncbi:hypothetical protein G7Y89_g15742 [Cudoniella acicularis]|uniref:Uncharacterized protein n=1 Tax=Cudoniella acicularis TaxID=354080 RepID=A0A8H4VI76_9HELO|nr:hypothetical protein G7Y89_g15742 [Cudoniella acicularis]